MTKIKNVKPSRKPAHRNHNPNGSGSGQPNPSMRMKLNVRLEHVPASFFSRYAYGDEKLLQLVNDADPDKLDAIIDDLPEDRQDVFKSFWEMRSRLEMLCVFMLQNGMQLAGCHLRSNDDDIPHEVTAVDFCTSDAVDGILINISVLV